MNPPIAVPACWTPSLWAPAARQVEIIHGPLFRRQTLVPSTQHSEGGWWVAEDPLPASVDYAFSLDGGPPRPDPRSRWQPHGVHASSRHYNPDTFAWQDQNWAGIDVRDSILYELHVGAFTMEGTFAAASERLDHLAELGINLIELMPVAAFAGHHGWGYDGVCLYAVHEPYGGPLGLQRFVDAAHARGIGVCLDVVYNHLGPSGNYLAEFGEYFSRSHQTPWGAALNLDGDHSAVVRQFLIDNACYWFEQMHVDALRLDAVHALIDTSAYHWLAELADVTASLSEQLGRPLSLIAESDLNQPNTVLPTARGGLGMTAQWADDVHHAVHTWLTGERHGYYADFGSLEVLEKSMRDVFVHDGSYSSFRARHWGAPLPRTTDARRFVVCSSNHDQIGNRALGDRPGARLDDGELAIAAALILTAPFTPLLFMGEEWGARAPFLYFTDHQEPALAEAVRVGRRREFGSHGWEALYADWPSAFEQGELAVPDPQDASTFEASRLDWREPQQPGHRRLLDWYRSLIALRQQHHWSSSALDDWQLGVVGADGRARNLSDTSDESAADRVLLISRRSLRVLINGSGDVAHFVTPSAADHTLHAWQPEHTWRSEDGRVRLPARSVALLVPSC